MDLIEAAANTRAMCRECGAAIRLGEPRFGRPEGTGEDRKIRWRHLSCAAASMPKALLHALELGGWRSVPEVDHEELRGLIERGQRRPPPEDSGFVDLAARSSSAMAAAAVLEPAHEAEDLAPERARAWVIADALQARGDVRGELLALELAVEHTRDHAQARALQLEHAACWRRFAPTPLPSKQLRLRWIGGFLRAAHPQSLAELQTLLRSPAAAELERLRFDFCTQDELELLVGLLRERAHPLLALELPHARQRSLVPLAALDGLERLRVSERFDGDWLAQLPSLRALSLGAGTFVELELLSGCSRLEQLELSLAGPQLGAHLFDDLARAAPHLRRLQLRGGGAVESLGGLTQLPALERLCLPDIAPRQLDALSALPQLRELELEPGTHRAVEQLADLRTLEGLVLRGSKVAELEPLAELEQCTHLALVGTRATALKRLRPMPKLRSLALEGGDMRRVQGLERLRELSQLTLSKLANLDLSVIEPLTQLDTLVLIPQRGRARHLEVLLALPQLRRLSVALQELQAFASSSSRPLLLEALEVLELRGDGLPSDALLRRFPRLRHVLLPGRTPEALVALAQRHPGLAVFGELPPRDHFDHRDPFDWRTLGWVPRGYEAL